MSLCIRKAKTDFKAVKLHVIGINYPLKVKKKKKKADYPMEIGVY